MKKILSLIINLIKRILSIILNILKKIFFVGPKSKKKLLMIPIVLILLAVAAYLTGFLGPWGDRGNEQPEETATESIETEEESEKENADDAELETLKGYLAYDFIKTLRSENYLIRYHTTTLYHGESFHVETVYAVSGSSIALSSGDRATIIHDNMVCMINHTDRSMISWNATTTDNLKKIDTQKLSFAGSSTEDGLVCEVYQTATAEMKLYFDEDQLVRMATRINGLDTVMEIEEVTEEAPANLFVVPSDYQNTNITQ